MKPILPPPRPQLRSAPRVEQVRREPQRRTESVAGLVPASSDPAELRDTIVEHAIRLRLNQEHHEGHARRFKEFEDDLSAIRSDAAAEIGGVKADISEIKNDVSTIKLEIAKLVTKLGVYGVFAGFLVTILSVLAQLLVKIFSN